MSSNLQPILDALDDYAKQTGIDLSNNPFGDKLRSCESSGAILELLEGQAKAFKDYRDGNRKLIDWLSPVVEVIHKFSGILDEASILVPFPPAHAILVGIDVLFTTASRVSASYDALTELFECIGNFLKRFHIYTEIPFTPAMTDIIVRILVEVLSVFALATKQIKQGRLKKFAKKLLGEREIEVVLERLDRLTEAESRMTVAQTLEVVHGLVNNMKVVMDDGKASTDGIRKALVTMQETANEIHKMKRDQLQKDVQNWLSPPDPSTNHDIASGAYQTETAAWFFQGTMFATWKATGSLLWIHGKPGSGKSTLLSAIIQDIEHMRVAGLASMAYYYFDFRDTTKQDVRGFVSSLLSQLCAQSTPCYDTLSRFYSAHDDGTRKPIASALAQCLMDVLEIQGQGPIYIIVDALDECPNTGGLLPPREKVLELLEDLVNLHIPNLHICATSRFEVDIQNVLEPLTSLRLSLHDESGQRKDILDYITKIVNSDRRMRGWREEDKKLVIDTLSQRADGMYRWVVCQFDRLRRSFPASIRSALDDLPRTLDETYDHTLLGIDEEKWEYSHRLFQCLTMSIRPLLVEELAENLAVRFDAGAPPTYNADWRPGDSEEAVLSACSSLVAITNVGGSQVVQFAHFSAKEFLISGRLATAEEKLSRYHVLPHLAHTILAQASLSVLLNLDDKIDKNTIQKFPLAKYAARHWVDHAQFENVWPNVEDMAKRIFDPEMPYFATWVWIYDIDYPFGEHMFATHPVRPETTPLYYATLCGFKSLVNHLLVTRPGDVNARGGYHGSPLHAAFAKRYVDVAVLLLEHGADINALDSESLSSLHRASRSGHRDVVQCLLEHHADVNIVNGKGETPLHLASEEGELEVTRLLVGHGADANARDEKGCSPLDGASRCGHLDIVRLLLDSGADLKSKDNNGWTPLHTASRYGRSDVVQELLNRGAEVNAQKEGQLTPLHLASRNGNIEIVQLLIQHGAVVDIPNEEQETSLDLASGIGALKVVRFLIERGANANRHDNRGWTPLHTASQAGHLDVVEILLQCAVDVNARNVDEDTPLDLALDHEKVEVARFLIEKGVDLNSRDKKGWTPLHTASKAGYLDIVEVLLQHGVDVNIRNRNGETPLDVASGHGKLEVTRFLVERGADVNSRDKNGWTPYHTASQRGHLDVVKFFLQCGTEADVRNAKQQTALSLASVQGRLEVARHLIECGADVNSSDVNGWTPLHSASRYGHHDMARLLLDQGADMNAQKGDGWTPLHLAAGNGNLDVAQLLLERGADLNIQNEKQETPLELASNNGKLDIVRLLTGRSCDVTSQGDVGQAPVPVGNPSDAASSRDRRQNTNIQEAVSLRRASKNGDVDTVRSLLDRGADVNERNANNETPLDLASSHGKLEVARLLIERGADVNCRDKAGWTPLHGGSRFDYPDIVQLLLEHGADANAKKQDHWTPLHLASYNGYLEIVKILLERGADANLRNGDGRTPLQTASAKGHRNIAQLLLEHGTR